MPCLPCLADVHFECFVPQEESCCCPVDIIEPTERTRALKDDSFVTDIESTGRKRAAKEFPLEEGMACEWRGLKFAGGGIEPITGCIDGIGTNRHHGPDKNTLNNTVGNVHRICPKCHNRWHTKNDPHYSVRPADGSAFLPFGGECKAHDKETIATAQEVAMNEIYWATNPAKRAEKE